MRVTPDCKFTSSAFFNRSKQLGADPTEYYPGSTDMVRHWHKLGFVAKVPEIVIGDFNLPVWVENERMRIDDTPVFKLPF